MESSVQFEIRNNSFKLSYFIYFFFIKTFYGLSRKLSVSPKHGDKAVIYLGKTQMTLDVNTFQR